MCTIRSYCGFDSDGLSVCVAYIDEHRPPAIPQSPDRVYKRDGWHDWDHWLGYDDLQRYVTILVGDKPEIGKALSWHANWRALLICFLYVDSSVCAC